MKDSEILKKARELIAAEQEDYICHALTSIGQGTFKYLDQTESLQRWVLSMMSDTGNTSLGGWLEMKGIATSSRRNGSIRDLRLHWLDWMIQYCELEEAGWTPWLGGETPPETCSRVLLRTGLIISGGPSRPCWWRHENGPSDIIAYKP